ncbi:hypothetical protein NW762_011618 [Fusarium torreyae]|uniref:NACHT-NTPase and P-loop NTPases N-terminal domain-containing protein n=1 Tax=Fusarium torreyae TaxID=1237075 RepID=A0A9W8RQR8_9HYPO|nr:hypothetical protein NW762_011618 [Fusarium torreyae]
MDPLGVIASTISVIQAISSTYGAIRHLRGLPHEFDKVARNLPLARDTLGLARDHLQGLALDESSKNALQPLISNCDEKAKMLQDIFDKVKESMKDGKDGSVLDFYRTSLLRLGKAHRVENLMGDILKDLNALSTNRLFATVTQSQMAQLRDAINELSHVGSSVSDSEFESPASNTLINNDNATGYMTNISGQDHKINPGSGDFYNAHNITFDKSNGPKISRSDILQALYASPYRDRKNLNPYRVPGKCEWFVSHENFRKWRVSESSGMLWVSANPGCGKSVLARHLVDSELPTTESRTTCYFFFKDDFKDPKIATSALSCILHQLFTQRKVLFSDEIVKRFDDFKTHINSSFDELWEVLVMAAKDDNAGELVCILDAFDECDDQQRDKFVQALQKLYDSDSGAKHEFNLKFLITSRPYRNIRLNFQSVVHLEGEGEEGIVSIAREVDAYIDYRVSCIRDDLFLQPDETALLLRQLRRVPNQTYLWVYLTLNLIEKDYSIDQAKIREATYSLPQTLDDAYERILARSGKPKEAKKLLHIIVAAARPLTLAEMDIALSLRKEHRSYQNLETRPEERVRKYVTDLCGLFITITSSKIYLLHQTAKEFLVPNFEPHSTGSYNGRYTWKHSLQPSESHLVLFEICIQLLLFTVFEDKPIYAPVYVEGRPILDNLLADYSAMNWATHFRVSDIKDDTVIDSVRKICNPESMRCSNWFGIYWMLTHRTIAPRFTSLMIAAYFGLGQIVKLHLEAGDVDINSTDSKHGRSALSWASENGYDNVVKLLIRGPKLRWKTISKLSFLKGAKVDAQDAYGRTPLSYAAWNGHMAIVDRLVKQGARVNLQDKISGTPISYALVSGEYATYNRLKEATHIGSVDVISRNLLFSAAKQDNMAVVERLLENGADKEMVDNTGRGLLSYAVAGECTGVVQLLIDKGVDVNSKPNEGFTPLGWAVQMGSKPMITRLLEGGARVNDTFIRVSNPALAWWLDQ